MQKIVIATSNEGKLKEFKELFLQFGLKDIELVTLAQVLGADYEEPVEDGADFTANAYIKANHAAKLTGLPALADDSGLCVPLLDNQPGIFTARFAQLENYSNPQASNKDQLNYLCLLDKVKPFRATNPQIDAYFMCALAFVRYSNDPAPATALGTCDGYILEQPVGDQGHGYDPVFFSTQVNAPFGVLPLEVKNQVSHRYQAFANWVQQAQSLGLLKSN